MAGDWIKVRSRLHDDPGVIRIAALCEVSRNEAVGALVGFWSWADEATVNGHVPGVTGCHADEYARLPGFAKALQDVGWLKVTESGISIPHFERHMSESAKSRGLATQRQRKSRSRFRHAGP